MTDNRYIDEKAAAPGTDFALVRLFAAEDLRPSITALHALYNELMNVAYTVSDPGVAAAKLGWWQEEIGRAFDGTTRHPVLEALAGDIQAGRLDRDELVNLARGAGRNVDPEPFADDDALDEFCRQTAGMRARAEARLAGASDLDAAESLGAASARAMLWHLLPRDLPLGRLFVPQDAMARHQVTRHHLSEADPAARPLVKDLSSHTRERIADAVKTIPTADAGPLRHLLAQAAVDRSRLKRVHRAGERALKSPPTFPPVLRVLAAWRAAGKAQRQYLASR